MKNNRGFAPLVLIALIVGALAVGGGVYYVETKGNVGNENKVVENLNTENKEAENIKKEDIQKSDVSGSGYEIKNIKEFISSGYDNSPSWSPDGKLVAASLVGHNGIYIKDIASGKEKLLTSDKGSGFRYSWSPDSKAIVYLLRDFKNGETNNIIKLVEIESGKTTELTPEGVGSSMPAFTKANEVVYSYKGSLIKRKWNGISIGKEEVITSNVPANIIVPSLRGDKLIIENDEGIYIIDNNGNNKKIIVKHDEKGLAGMVKVSSDGNNVLFANQHLFVYNISSGKISDLGIALNHQWLSNNKIIYNIINDDGHIITGSDIYVMNLDGTNKTQVTDTKDQIELDPVVSLDGKSIVYQDRTSEKLYIGELVIK